MYNELQHHGIKGQKWGVRRFQNPDGTLTSAGRDRYGHEHDQRIKEGFLNRNGIRSNPSFGTPKTVLGKPVSLGGSSRLETPKNVSKQTQKAVNDYNNLSDQEFVNKYGTTKEKYRKRVKKYGDPYMNSPMAKFAKKRDKIAKDISDRKKAKIDAKEEKQWRKENNNNMLNDEVHYMQQYDDTPEGKKKKQQYEKAIKRMERSSDNWGKKEWTEFSKIEEDYLKSAQKHAANKMLEKYGDEELSRYVNNGKKGKDKEAVNKIIDKWDRHRY